MPKFLREIYSTNFMAEQKLQNFNSCRSTQNTIFITRIAIWQQTQKSHRHVHDSKQYLHTDLALHDTDLAFLDVHMIPEFGGLPLQTFSLCLHGHHVLGTLL